MKIPYLILARPAVDTPEATNRSIGTSVGKSVMLEALVVSNMLGELTERVARRRTLGSTHERHFEDVGY